ncbi:CBS domain-containing protein [Miltoncostaea marina]|uniref:CBS domain-containing protein n=1 Tax=Miltoncostaea marina TaxID=2843215 RepID=UPI001C3CA527|nr:CBS domain-containing protein [Miltoncostaea marina]
MRDPETRPAGGATLADARVADVMGSPVVTCDPDLPLADVAALMAGHRIHAVVVLGDEAPGGRLRVISEMDLVRAATLDDAAVPAGRVAATPPVTVGRDAPLEAAARLMAQHDTAHVVVVDEGHPVGVVSALDVAARLAPEAPPPPEPPAPAGLRGAPGDRLVIHGHRLGEPSRDAEVLEARGPEGTAPFLVRWEDSGHVTLLYPGSDARIERITGG